MPGQGVVRVDVLPAAAAAVRPVAVEPAQEACGYRVRGLCWAEVRRASPVAELVQRMVADLVRWTWAPADEAQNQ